MTKVELSRQPFAAEFDKIKSDLIELHWVWNSYKKLFATSKERVELLNHNVQTFALLLQRRLADDVMLSICRLTDKRKDTLTLEKLARSMQSNLDQKQRKWLKDQIASIKTDSASIKEHRDNRIAHKNAVLTMSAATPWPSVTHSQIEQLLSGMRKFMQEISDWHDGVEFDFWPSGPGDANSFIVALQMADRLNELQNDHHGSQLSDTEVLAKLADRTIKPI